jgi:hypothetical protein
VVARYDALPRCEERVIGVAIWSGRDSRSHHHGDELVSFNFQCELRHWPPPSRSRSNDELAHRSPTASRARLVCPIRPQPWSRLPLPLMSQRALSDSTVCDGSAGPAARAAATAVGATGLSGVACNRTGRDRGSTAHQEVGSPRHDTANGPLGILAGCGSLHVLTDRSGRFSPDRG